MKLVQLSIRTLYRFKIYTAINIRIGFKSGMCHHNLPLREAGK